MIESAQMAHKPGKLTGTPWKKLAVNQDANGFVRNGTNGEWEKINDQQLRILAIEMVYRGLSPAEKRRRVQLDGSEDRYRKTKQRLRKKRGQLTGVSGDTIPVRNSRMKNSFSNQSHYFAYGSIPNEDDLKEFCERANVPFCDLKPVGVLQLPDYRLSFPRYSQGRDGGALKVVPSGGDVAEGMLFEVPDAAAWKTLDRKEGHAVAYERRTVQLFDERDQMIEGVTYVVKDELVRNFVKPAPSYVEVVKRWLGAFEMSTDALHAAARNELMLPMIDAIFTYGKLMRNECRFPVLKDFGIHCVFMAETTGQLIGTVAYPRLLHDDSLDFRVQSEYVRLTNARETIRCLDEIEGLRGYGANSLFERRLTYVHVGAGKVRLSWIYVWAGDEEYPVISSGSWRKQRATWDTFVAQLVDWHGVDQVIPRLAKLYSPFGDSMKCPGNRAEIIAQLYDGRISERMLAAASQVWTAMVN